MLWVYFALAGGFCPVTGWVRKRTPYGVHSRKGASSIARNSFIQISKLHDVRGRIDYISSHARQENLYATYQTADMEFWKNLAKENQQEFIKSGTDGKCIEARELIIALPEIIQNIIRSRYLKHLRKHLKTDTILNVYLPYITISERPIITFI